MEIEHIEPDNYPALENMLFTDWGDLFILIPSRPYAEAIAGDLCRPEDISVMGMQQRWPTRNI